MLYAREFVSKFCTLEMLNNNELIV